MALFEAHNLHMRFGDRVVLEDISLAFEEGGCYGIIGPNGAGKTTCFNVLTGRYRPSRGQVILAGEEITGLRPHLIARRGISRSFQIMNLFDDFTARQNVLTALPSFRARGFDPVHAVTADAALIDEADAVLDRVGLGSLATQPARALSYGNRRALEIGVALAARPRLLFLDEPTSGLGADGTARLSALIASLRGELVVVIIEHDMHFLFALADHVSVIHWGQVIAEGTPSALRQNSWVQNSNLGKLQ